MPHTDSKKHQDDDWQKGELFHKFRNACTMNDPKSALNSLTAWLGHFCQEQQYASTKQFSQAIGNKRVAEQLAVVREAVEYPETDWSGEELYMAVIEVLHEIRTDRANHK